MFKSVWMRCLISKQMIIKKRYCDFLTLWQFWGLPLVYNCMKSCYSEINMPWFIVELWNSNFLKLNIPLSSKRKFGLKCASQWPWPKLRLCFINLLIVCFQPCSIFTTPDFSTIFFTRRGCFPSVSPSITSWPRASWWPSPTEQKPRGDISGQRRWTLQVSMRCYNLTKGYVMAKSYRTKAEGRYLRPEEVDFTGEEEIAHLTYKLVKDCTWTRV